MPHNWKIQRQIWLRQGLVHLLKYFHQWQGYSWFLLCLLWSAYNYMSTSTHLLFLCGCKIGVLSDLFVCVFCVCNCICVCACVCICMHNVYAQWMPWSMYKWAIFWSGHKFLNFWEGLQSAVTHIRGITEVDEPLQTTSTTDVFTRCGKILMSWSQYCSNQ